MSEAFAAYVETLDPNSADAVELVAASGSADALGAYAGARGLDLSKDDAERLAATGSAALDDAALEDVAGGLDLVGSFNAGVNNLLARIVKNCKAMTGG